MLLPTRISEEATLTDTCWSIAGIVLGIIDHSCLLALSRNARISRLALQPCSLDSFKLFCNHHSIFTEILIVSMLGKPCFRAQSERAGVIAAGGVISDSPKMTSRLRRHENRLNYIPMLHLSEESRMDVFELAAISCRLGS